MGSNAWTFDVWFDNIFSDLNMQGRINDAATRVTTLQADLQATRHRVEAARATAALDAANLAAQAASAFTAG